MRGRRFFGAGFCTRNHEVILSGKRCVQNLGRPRINKPGSQLDKEQKRDGEYYYTN
jgi:translation initiation factor RLI1